MSDSPTRTMLVDDPQMPRLGAIVGQRYEVQHVLGEGGFAVVYSAYDARTKAQVAIKVLDPIMSRRSEFASRFMREVETVSRLRHHNSISIFDAGETANGCLYLVMELLDGKPLDAVLDEAGTLAPERVRAIAMQILKSLQEAHSKGIIHRDLKPANVFIADIAGERDYVKVLDFGIAKSVDESQDSALTATGQVMCSPHYVAPERVKEHMTVPASDLYSLGVMMVELLEGRPPYEAETPMALAVKHLAADPVPLGAASRSAPFAHVIARACAKPLSERYESATQMLEDLAASDAAAAGATLRHAQPAATEATPEAGRTAVLGPHGRTDGLGPDGGRPKRLVLAIVGGFVLVGLALVAAILRFGSAAPDGPDAAATGIATPEAMPATGEPTAPSPAQPEGADPVPPPGAVVPVTDGSAAGADLAAASEAAGGTLAGEGSGSADPAALAEPTGTDEATDVAAAEADERPEPDERPARTRTSRERDDDAAAPTPTPSEPAAAPAEADAPPTLPAAEPAPVEVAPEPEPEVDAEEPEGPRRRIRTNVAPIQ